MVKNITLVAFTLILCSATIRAAEAPDLLQDIDLEIEIDMGLEDVVGSGPAMATNAVSVAERSPFRYTLDHAMSFNPGREIDLINNRTGIGFAYEGLIYNSLFAKLDIIGDIYWAQDHVAQSNNDRNYSTYSRIKEAWLQHAWSKLNIKVGAQSIVWSEVEGGYATDAINPIDNRELLFVEFEDARIAQWMLSFSVFTETIAWEGFVNFIPEFNLNPPGNSIYYFAPPFDIGPIDEASTPDPEFGLRGKLSVGASELAAFVARLTPNQPSLESFDGGLREVAKAFWFFGLNSNYAVGQTLWKADIGYKTKLTYSYIDVVEAPSLALQEKDTLDLALGVEHTWKQHLLSASINYSVILGWEKILLTPRQLGLLSLGWGKTYLHEDLSINAFIGSLLNRSTSFATLLADYKLNDRIALSSSLFVFSVTDKYSEFYQFRDENRISIKVKYQL